MGHHRGPAAARPSPSPASRCPGAPTRLLRRRRQLASARPGRGSCWSASSSRTRWAPAPPWSCRPIPLVGTSDDVDVELPATSAGTAAGRRSSRRSCPATSTPAACRRVRPTCASTCASRDLRVVERPATEPPRTPSPRSRSRPHALDRAGRGCRRTTTGPCCRSGPRTRSCASPAGSTRSRSCSVGSGFAAATFPAPGPRPGRRDRHARRPRSPSRWATSSTSTWAARASRSSSNAMVAYLPGSADGRRRAGRPRPADPRGPARLVDGARCSTSGGSRCRTRARPALVEQVRARRTSASPSTG